MSERPTYVRKTIFQGSGNPSMRFEECQKDQQETEPKLPKTINQQDFLPGWSELLQQIGLDEVLELNTNEELDTPKADGCITEP